MTFAEFERKIQDAADRLRNGGGPELASRMESEALQFVDDNFQNQSWEGVPWAPRNPDLDPGRAILTKSGHLRDGFRTHIEPGAVRVTNVVSYAKTHNEGFRGVVYVRPHHRSRFVKAGKGGRVSRTGRHQVKAHARRVVMRRRQFAPTTDSPSPTLNANISQVVADYVREQFDTNAG